MKSALVFVGILTIVATLLPRIRSDQWWIRVFDYPRLQIAAMITVTAALFALVYDWNSPLDAIFVFALLLALGHQILRIYPYTPLAPCQVARTQQCDPGIRLRLLTANVLMDNRRGDAFLRIVQDADPDVLLALETDDWWDRQLTALDAAFPFAVKHPLDNTYGMHLLSKLPLEAPQLRYLIEEGVPSIETGLRLRSGQAVTLHCLHPRPPRPAQDTGERDAELLITGRAVKADQRPAIVFGDLNDVAWSHTTRLFQRISGLLDPRVGRGLFATFNAKVPFARWPLDHVFHATSFKLCEIRRLGYFGSDHFPILVDLCYQPAAAHEQTAPASDREDRLEAGEKIRAGRNPDAPSA